jgi:hypothetical protein
VFVCYEPWISELWVVDVVLQCRCRWSYGALVKRILHVCSRGLFVLLMMAWGGALLCVVEELKKAYLLFRRSSTLGRSKGREKELEH